MKNPPTGKDSLFELLNRLGIAADKVTVLTPDGAKVELQPERTDNVIPFPKSSNRQVFGKRTVPPSPITEAHARMHRMFEANRNYVDHPNFRITGAITILFEGDDPNGHMIVQHTGLTKYEMVGLLNDTLHDVLCGTAEFEDMGPPAA